MKSWVYLDEVSEDTTVIYFYAAGLTDVLGNGVFILTDGGQPGSWWCGYAKDDKFGIDTINPQQVADYYGVQVMNRKPPILTMDADIIAQGGEMHGRHFPEPKTRVLKKDRSLSQHLSELRDKALFEMQAAPAGGNGGKE